ncbi:MAG: methyltransferase domain-containing protein [Rhodothermales bacterium]
MTLVNYYSRRAAEYELIYQKPERQEVLVQLRPYVQQLFAGHNVLELACGTGYWTEVIASSAKSVQALDASEEVLSIARSKSYPNKQIKFGQADVYVLDDISSAFSSGFSAGLAAFWWSHVSIEKLPAFLESFHSKLNPGAQVCFIDNNYVEGSSTPVSDQDALGNTYQLRRLKDGTEHRVMKNFPSREHLIECVSPFARDIMVKDFEYFWCLSYKTLDVHSS